MKLGTGLYQQIDYTDKKAIILDKHGKKKVVPYIDFEKYYHPDNTHERLRRIKLYIESDEGKEPLKIMLKEIEDYLNKK